MLRSLSRARHADLHHFFLGGGGQLICLARDAIFLLRGEDRYCSPSLNEFVTIVENRTPTKKIETCRKVAARFLLYGAVHRRSPMAMLQIVFDSCIKQLVRWQSFGVERGRTY